MKKFQSNVNRELSRSYPDRRRLETQCLSLLMFVKSENSILDCPIWILIVNVVALDMLKSKMPPGMYCVLELYARGSDLLPKFPLFDSYVDMFIENKDYVTQFSTKKSRR